MIKSIIIYSKIFPYIKKKRKLQIIFTIFLSILVSITESLGIGSLLPFIASIIDPEKIYSIPIIKNIFHNLNFNIDHLTIIFGSVFIFLVLFSSFLKIVLLKINSKISYSLIGEICTTMFKKIISQPYHLHLGKNSSDIIATLMERSNSVGETTYFLISIINSLLFLFFITLTITLMAPFNILNLLIFLLIFYFLVFLFIRKKIKLNSLNISQQSGNLIKITQEALGSIREILIYKISNFFVPKFSKANSLLRNAIGNQVFIAGSPSHLLQALILVSGIIFLYYLNYREMLIDFVPIIAVIILAIQKLFPNVQTVFASLTSITVKEYSLKKTAEILVLSDTSEEKIKNKTNKNNKGKLMFKNAIEFKNVCFSYSNDGNFKLDNIGFSIKKGEKIGINGPSGSGKSTLVNLLLGLLTPTSGQIFLDNNKLEQNNIELWQEKIAFVSQNIFLSDESILQNISFSDDKKNVNTEKINKVLEDVNLINYVNKLPDGINSKVGERGSKLSGGQVQRIGIARALFKNKEVIVLDEATNSIDKHNEETILDNLSKINGLTLILISHNDHLLKKCDQIFLVNDGKLQKVS